MAPKLLLCITQVLLTISYLESFILYEKLHLFDCLKHQRGWQEPLISFLLILVSSDSIEGLSELFEVLIIDLVRCNLLI